ncbi:lysylphosphatidylglycerol synthase transmembrane domain-containing protein [Vibrio breoganii]|nr:hypothetical protein BCU79_01010 [Vibrio breoganii]PMK41097.1 hypothetical protein BCU00_01895 [Vibrio breoganii]
MRNRLKKYFGALRKFYFLIAILYVAIVVSNNQPNLGALKLEIKALSIHTLSIAIAMVFLSYVVRSIRWLNYIRVKDPYHHWSRHFLIYLSGFAFTASPAKTGELMRGLYLYKLGVNFRFTVCSFFSERLLDLLVVSCLASYFLTIYLSSLFTLVPVIALLIIATTPVILSYLSEKSYRASIKKFVIDLTELWHSNSVIKSIFLTFIAWALQGAVLYLLLLHTGISISPLLAISIYSVSLLIGAISLIPGGIGITEITMAWLLTQMSVSYEASVVIALLTRAMTLWPAIAIGLLSCMTINRVSPPPRGH